MKVTSHNLSYDKVELDLSAMLDVAEHAYHMHIASMLNKLNEMQYSVRSSDLTSRDMTGNACTAEVVCGEAAALRVAAETFHALLGLKDREEVEFVNKPHGDVSDDSELTSLAEVWIPKKHKQKG